MPALGRQVLERVPLSENRTVGAPGEALRCEQGKYMSLCGWVQAGDQGGLIQEFQSMEKVETQVVLEFEMVEVPPKPARMEFFTWQFTITNGPGGWSISDAKLIAISD